MLPKGPYNSGNTEPEILKYWLDGKFFKPEYHPERGLLSTEEMKTDGREPFCIVNPPPNAYMRPHIGNVSGYAYQDVFLRYNRMKGKKVLGQPGKDHAGIQGEVVLEKIFWENKKKTKQDMGRDKFYKASYSHFLKLMPMVMADEQRIGLSSDYDRNIFTLDPKIVKTVLGTFTKMFEDKMVYKGVRIVNWDPIAKTTLADIDTEREERDGELVYINYPIAGENKKPKIKTIVFDIYGVVVKADEQKTIDQEIIALIKDLKHQNYKIGLLSNTKEENLVEHDSDGQYLKLFDFQYFAADTNNPKPDPKAYEKFEEKYSLKPEEILFIDDNIENLSPAKKRGWITFHYQDNTENLKKFIETGREYLTVATTRAETMLGDTAVVINPKDERYKDLIGKKLILPLVDREIPVITSPHVDMEFGTGAVKLTPAHSMDDYKMMNEWNVENGEEKKVGYINVIDKDAKMTGPIPEKYKGLTTEECREEISKDLEKQGLIVKREPHKMNVMIGERSKAVVEQIMSSQWFIDVEKLKQPAIDAVKNGEVQIHPDYMKKKYLHWMENLHDWPVSRSLWWGYRIPVWYKGEVKEEVNQETGQIIETINGVQVDGIYDAVAKGLAKVQIDEPGSENRKNLFLIPGKHGYANRKLFPEIKNEYPHAAILDVKGLDDPEYKNYVDEFKKYDFDEASIIVAHSLGTRAILRYLLDNKIKVNSLIMLAPGCRKPRSNGRDQKYLDLITNAHDYDQLKDLIKNIDIVYSDNDELMTLKNFEDFVKLIPGAKAHLEKNKMHYASSDYGNRSEIVKGLLKEKLDANIENNLTKFTVVRHAQTDHNKIKAFCGSLDPKLNRTGQVQAEMFARTLKESNEKYDMIISSDLKRAKETAEIIAKELKLEVISTELIRERDFGILEGKTWQQVETEYPKLAKKIEEQYQEEIPEGESINKVEDRVRAFLDMIRNDYSGKKILLVTHFGIIRILKRELLGETPEESRKGQIDNLQRFEMRIKPESDWIQDLDVFDTWFSSGQWAYAPLIANDLIDTFYPTDIMETMHDILELWVSRMMMLSLYTQKKIPFKHVYLHGMVKAADGQKMSKSKGNVVLPEEIIEKYGADSLRLMYLVGNKAGASYPVSYEKLEGYKRFLNKIWNASKFVLSNTENIKPSDKSSNKEDKKLLRELMTLKQTIIRHIDNYRIGMAAEELYSHFWHYFCDVFLEEVKPRLYTKDREGNPINQGPKEQKSRKEAQSVLLYALREYMKMLNPFIPFITERIWQEIEPEKTIMYESWV
ncbi:HAD-IA family hydrolase [Candidatus Dojkabacteria bacterium]|nr:HAD-IA family hydrolase [Candidatus Dojkabacteria bacterium]